MHAWTVKNNEYLWYPVTGAGVPKISDHFHPVHADGLYTHPSNAVIRQKVVVYDGKGRISPEDRNQGT
jgi:hypothetical protein